MQTMIRFGIAAAAALAFTSTARACDVARWDLATDGPREGACPTVVTYAPPDATDYDVSAVISSYRLAARSNEETSGSGSGEPGAADPPRSQPSEDEFLLAIWTAP